MVPDWMKHEDEYVPPRSGGTFIIKTLKSMGSVMRRLRVQRGHEKGLKIPVQLKILGLLGVIVFIAVTNSRMALAGIAAVLLVYLCTWPAIDIWNVIKTSGGAGLIAVIIMLPAAVMNPAGIGNNLAVVAKVLMSVAFVAVFNHTTYWNHITVGLRKLKVPGIFIFTLDITLRFIVLLGRLICEMLEALSLRSVGRARKEYESIGGIMGVTFTNGVQKNREMYEAMVCRGFTDDYRGL